MVKLKSIFDLNALRERLAASAKTEIPTVVITAGTCGQASGANDLIRIAKREILTRGLTERLNLRITGCHGYCEMEPSVLIEPKGTFYPKVSIDDVPQIIDAASKGTVVDSLLYEEPDSGELIETQNDLPFYKKQVRTILSGNEKIDPIRIFNYIENGGYSAVIKTFGIGKPDWVISEVTSSNLRGRGGAGFPTGLKWRFLAEQTSSNGKYLVCNADEGDPGAYMDRSILEGNPHSIIEGMIIGAYGTGVTEGIIYVRNEYPLAIKHLMIALRQARDLGLLGENIFGTGFSFDIKLVKGAGAFVCGEETALMRSIEGKMGEPRQRPPFPVQSGINGSPTAINNVETWANIPIIIRNGAESFKKIGTKNNSGTKIFSLVGKIRNTGLVEVPMGITIGEIIYDIGGGPVGNATIKAVQTGGPSGGCIPAEMFDLTIDYDSLSAAGSIMGSGGMIVMDEHTCMVDVAKYFMSFLKDESCGKCFTCRKGTQRMHELLDDISKGQGSLDKLDLLGELAAAVKDTTMCGLGQSASNPVLSTLNYFYNEYMEHLVDKRCKAFICSDLVGAPCQSACPLGTEAWRYIAHIAQGEYKEAYLAIRKPNPFPSVCSRVCSRPCESKCRSGTTGASPIAIRDLKRFVTDQTDPSVYKPERRKTDGRETLRVAVVGAGPAGLAAAHGLSILGYKVTVFENQSEPGGMLICGIPTYRLPRDILRREIESLIDENINLKCNTKLGRDITLGGLFDEGYKAVFLAIGAHKSRRLKVEGEDLDGVYPAIEFLKDFNLNGKKLAKGQVGVIGGGDSAIDAARVALRQEKVTGVTIYYRRTREEMPALQEEVDAALEEGIELVTLVSPAKIHPKDGKVASVEFIRNKLGGFDSSGRRRPVPIQKSEFTVKLDTLIVTIGEVPDIECVASDDVECSEQGTIRVDEHTLATNLPGVFAGGDVVTGPNTVVDAIADGKKAAVMIDRHLRGEKLRQVVEARLPNIYIESSMLTDEEMDKAVRPEPSVIQMKSRRSSLDEIELSLGEEVAKQEAKRCLRCDLEFTQLLSKEDRTSNNTDDYYDNTGDT
jgi:NADH-quinone oxidoreductase subunit F